MHRLAMSHIRDTRFLIKTLKKLWVNFIFTFLLHSLEKLSMEARDLLENLYFLGKPYYLIIPRSKRQIYVDLDKISTGSEKFVTGSESDPCRHLSTTAGLLPESGWTRPSEERNYKLFFVPNQGESNITNDTEGLLWCHVVRHFRRGLEKAALLWPKNTKNTKKNSWFRMGELLISVSSAGCPVFWSNWKNSLKLQTLSGKLGPVPFILAAWVKTLLLVMFLQT